MISPRQKFHLEPFAGLLNDPVGLVCFNGQYHVYFQWNSLRKDHSYKEWGHFSSPDLIHWKQNESPLKPGQEYDRNGVYSGSSLEVDGKILAWYTGNRKDNGARTVKQCLAVSNDGFHFDKKGPVLEQPGFTTAHFRDPKVLGKENQLMMLIGAQNLKKQGEILQFDSPDGQKWTFNRIVGLSKAANMIECPDMVGFKEQNLLLYCLQNRDMDTDECLDSISVYQMIPACPKEQVNLDQNFSRLDDGFDSFAAQTMKDPSGRILLLAWMNRLSARQEEQLADGSPSIHCLSLPRELNVQNGKLYQQPAREVRKLFNTTPHPLAEGALPQRAYRLTLKPHQKKIHSFSIQFNRGECQISWDENLGLFSLFRKDWASQDWEERSVRLDALEEAEVFMDVSSIEVFLNGGEKILSARILPGSCPAWISIQGLEADAGEIHFFKTDECFLLPEPDLQDSAVQDPLPCGQPDGPERWSKERCVLTRIETA